MDEEMAPSFCCLGGGSCLELLGGGVYAWWGMNEEDNDTICEHNCFPIGCHNFLVCRTRAPKDVIDSNGGFCLQCHRIFGGEARTFETDDRLCIVCESTAQTKCIKSPVCDHYMCIRCFRKSFISCGSEYGGFSCRESEYRNNRYLLNCECSFVLKRGYVVGVEREYGDVRRLNEVERRICELNSLIYDYSLSLEEMNDPEFDSEVDNNTFPISEEIGDHEKCPICAAKVVYEDPMFAEIIDSKEDKMGEVYFNFVDR